MSYYLCLWDWRAVQITEGGVPFYFDGHRTEHILRLRCSGCSLLLSGMEHSITCTVFHMLMVARVSPMQLRRVHGVLDWERGSIARHFSATARSTAVKEDGMCFSLCSRENLHPFQAGRKYDMN